MTEDKKVSVNEEVMDAALTELIEVVGKHNLTVVELLRVYANLGYSIGGSIDGFNPKEPIDVKDLKQKYYSDPSLGVALMLQSLMLSEWSNQILEQDEKEE